MVHCSHKTIHSVFTFVQILAPLPKFKVDNKTHARKQKTKKVGLGLINCSWIFDIIWTLCFSETLFYACFEMKDSIYLPVKKAVYFDIVNYSTIQH